MHLGNLGLAYADLGETRRAIEFYEQALAIAREIGDRRGEGADAGQPGHCLLRPWARPAAPSSSTSRRWPLPARSATGAAKGQPWATWALAYADLGDARRAIEFYEQALAIAREIGDRRGEGNALGNLGIAYADLGETRRAIEFYEQRLAIAREIGDRRGEGNALGNLGIAYADLGETRRAIEFYEQALAIAREIGDRRGEGQRPGQPGHCLRRPGRDAAAPSSSTNSSWPSPARSATGAAKATRSAT